MCCAGAKVQHADVSTDVCVGVHSDGHMLLVLMEILGDTELPKPAKGKLRVRVLCCGGKCMHFAKHESVCLV